MDEELELYLRIIHDDLCVQIRKAETRLLTEFQKGARTEAMKTIRSIEDGRVLAYVEESGPVTEAPPDGALAISEFEFAQIQRLVEEIPRRVAPTVPKRKPARS